MDLMLSASSCAIVPQCYLLIHSFSDTVGFLSVSYSSYEKSCLARAMCVFDFLPMSAAASSILSSAHLCLSSYWYTPGCSWFHVVFYSPIEFLRKSLLCPVDFIYHQVFTDSCVIDFCNQNRLCSDWFVWILGDCSICDQLMFWASGLPSVLLSCTGPYGFVAWWHDAW